MPSSPNLLDQWISLEKTITERLDKGLRRGAARMDQVASMTGLALMQAILSCDLPYASIAKTRA